MRRPTDNYILTRADAERISDVVRNAEQRIGHIKARHRRRVVASRRAAVAGTPVIWGKIIETLAYPDPEGTPEEGVAQYKIELLGTSIEVSPRPLAQEANYPDLIDEPPDMRLFVPVYDVGAVVPLVRRTVTVGEKTETLYFFDLQMTRVAETVGTSQQSIRWNKEQSRLMAVFAGKGGEE